MTRLVTLHGFMGSPASWDASLASMRSTPVVVGLRCLGHGADSQAKTFDEEVRRLLDVLGDDGAPCVLAGYSLGARLALGMLTLAPQRFRGALLIGAHPGLEDENDRAKRRWVDSERARLLREQGLPHFVSEWEALPLFASQRSLDDATLARQRRVRLAHEADALAESLSVLGLGAMPSRWPSIPKLRTPVRWLVGAEDSRFVALARRVAEIAPRVATEVVAGAGHNLLLERPDVVAAELDASSANTCHHFAESPA